MAKCTLLFALTWSRDLNSPKLRFYFRHSKTKTTFLFYVFQTEARRGSLAGKQKRAANVCITGVYFDPMAHGSVPPSFGSNSGPAGLLVSSVVWFIASPKRTIVMSEWVEWGWMRWVNSLPPVGPVALPCSMAELGAVISKMFMALETLPCFYFPEIASFLVCA